MAVSRQLPVSGSISCVASCGLESRAEYLSPTGSWVTYDWILKVSLGSKPPIAEAGNLNWTVLAAFVMSSSEFLLGSSGLEVHSSVAGFQNSHRSFLQRRRSAYSLALYL